MNSFDACVLSSPNPFHDVIAPDALASATDSVAMFGEVLDGWSQALNAAAAPQPVGRAVVLAAAAGVGKTHLLLRFRLACRDRAVFSRLYPWPAADAFHHTLLAHLVGDWARSWPDGAPGPLFELAQAEGDADARQDPLRRALGLLLQDESRGVALRWLRGDSLPDDLLIGWELPAIDAPMAARRLAFDLMQRMAARRPLVLAFDQLDSAPRRGDGAPDLAPLFAFLAELRGRSALSARCLVILSLLEDNWRRLKEDPAQAAAVALLDKRRGWSFLLKGSTAEECRAAAARRLAPLHAQAAEDERPEDPLHPLPPTQMTDSAILGAKSLIPMRAFLRYAGAVYQSFKSRILSEADDAPLSPPPPPPQPRRAWMEQQAAVKQLLQREKVNDAEALRGLALAWAGLIGAPIPADQPALPSPDGAYGRLTPDGRVAIWWEADSNHKFVNFIKRLTAEAAAHPQRGFLFLRSAGLPGAGLKGRDLFDALFADRAHRAERPSTDLKVMATAVRRLDVMLRAGELPGLTPQRMLAGLKALGAFEPLRKLLGLPPEAAPPPQPGAVESAALRSAPPPSYKETPPAAQDGAPSLDDIQDVIDEFLSVELLVGWPHVRERVLALLPEAKPAQVVKAAEALVRAHGARWVNPNAALELRLLTLPVGAAA